MPSCDVKRCHDWCWLQPDIGQDTSLSSFEQRALCVKRVRRYKVQLTILTLLIVVNISFLAMMALTFFIVANITILQVKLTMGALTLLIAIFCIVAIWQSSRQAGRKLISMEESFISFLCKRLSQDLLILGSLPFL